MTRIRAHTCPEENMSLACRRLMTGQRNWIASGDWSVSERELDEDARPIWTTAERDLMNRRVWVELVTRLGNDEHYPYEGKCQDRTVGIISVCSQGRTRDRGAHRRVSRVWIRGFGGRNGGHDTEKLDIVVHGGQRGEVIV